MRSGKGWAAILVVSSFCLGSTLDSSDREILVYKKKYIMGTVFEICAYSTSFQKASSAIDKAFQDIVRMDDMMSNFKPESALSRLNQSAHFHRERVPSDLYRVIEEAVEFSELSAGKFDITIAPLVNLWKANLVDGSRPFPVQLQQAQACVGYQKIVLTPPDQITFNSACLEVDLGAIAKGYAVDRGVETLQSLGIHNAFISAGGSTIAATGPPPGQTGWLVHLRDPSHKFHPYLMLTNESVSTSEQSAPSLLSRNSAGHIIDRATGKPLETRFAVSVVARSGTLSDGLSTTLLLLGPTEGKALVSRTPDVSAIWLSPDSEIETATHGRQILFGAKM